MVINTDEEQFFHPYCLLSNNSNPCLGVHPLENCKFLCDKLNRNLDTKDIQEEIPISKVAIACHQRINRK